EKERINWAQGRAMPSVLSRLASKLALKLAQYYYSALVCFYLFWRWIRTAGAALKHKERQMPKKLLDNYNHKHLVLPSGINMHYVEAGESSAPLMVMIHGYPEFWYSWRFQIDHFKDRYRVVAIDQRGYGDSSKPPNITDYSIPALTKDIDDLIHDLGYNSAVVMAHDWGGAVAWRHALSYPQSVDQLIICNCPHPAAFGQMLRSNEEQRSHSWYMIFFQTPRVPEAAVAADDFLMLEKMFWSKYGLKNKENFTEEDMEAWKYTFSQPDALKSAINYYRCQYQHPEKGLKFGKCIPKTLIVWGDGDKFLVKENAELSVQWCEDATLRFIPGASHWVQQDDPAIVNQHIDEFLQTSNRPKSSY
ncbi:ceeh-2, partial [Pristionchus pacificus]